MKKKFVSPISIEFEELRRHVASECNAKTICWNCNCRKTGHLARDSPNDPVSNVAGHIARECSKSNLASEVVGGPFRDIICRTCGNPGHMSRDCAAIVIYNNCGGRGHLAYEYPSGCLLDRGLGYDCGLGYDRGLGFDRGLQRLHIINNLILCLQRFKIPIKFLRKVVGVRVSSEASQGVALAAAFGKVCTFFMLLIVLCEEDSMQGYNGLKYLSTKGCHLLCLLSKELFGRF